jgi:hypothetical protein
LGCKTIELCLLLACWLLFDPEDGSIFSSEMLAEFYQTTWHYNPEDGMLPHSHCCKKLILNVAFAVIYVLQKYFLFERKK